mmetsp:Transcript_25034/g.53339  ORF Transcript_25034/g.53339 Transcript_25034/m.53339 type:complete len:83 (+) Transcript_25034:783-1031(+)
MGRSICTNSNRSFVNSRTRSHEHGTIINIMVPTKSTPVQFLYWTKELMEGNNNISTVKFYNHIAYCVVCLFVQIFELLLVTA